MLHMFSEALLALLNDVAELQLSFGSLLLFSAAENILFWAYLTICSFCFHSAFLSIFVFKYEKAIQTSFMDHMIVREVYLAAWPHGINHYEPGLGDLFY